MRISSRLALFAVDVKHKRYSIRTSNPLRVIFEINPERTSKIWAHVNLLSECFCFWYLPNRKKTHKRRA
jgi:hypothetical protein